MDSENGCFTRYCRNVSQQRLILYGVIVVSIIVALILIFTLLLTGDNTSATPDKPKTFTGSSVLKNVPLIDGYNSLPELLLSKQESKIKNFPFDTDLTKSTTYTGYKTDLARLKTGMVGCQVWTIKPPCTTQLKDAVAATVQQLDGIIRLNKKYNDQMRIIDSSSQIESTFKDGKIGSFLSIDGGHAINNKLATLRIYYQLGVRSVTLTSECDTPWSTFYDTKKTTDLTKFGESVIAEMNRLGMIIDLSQSSLAVQKKVLSLSKAPVIFSSSALKHFVDSPLNIDDDVAKLIQTNKGLIMITFDPTTLQKPKTDTVTLENVVEQINYVAKTIGVDYVGIGSGFGKSEKTTSGLEDSSKYPALFDRLAKPKGDEFKWGKEELEKLAGLNFLRVFAEVEKVRDKLTDTVEEIIPVTDLSTFDTKYEQCYTGH